MNIFKKAVLVGVCMMMLSATAIAAEVGKGTTEGLNVRSAVNGEKPATELLDVNQTASATEKSGGWNKIIYRGKEVYVFGDAITVQFLDGAVQMFETPKYGVSTASYLNVRTDASEDAKVARRLYNGCKLELAGECGDFYAVQDEDGLQFVSKQYVDEITQEEYEKIVPGDNVIATAMQYIGTPYVYGGSTPSGFDCSGFVSYVYRKLGISLNRTAAGQMNNGYRVSLNELQRGDLVFFGSGGYIDHVGIYVGNGNMIHAPYSGRSVCVESIHSGYFGPRLAGARRIF